MSLAERLSSLGGRKNIISSTKENIGVFTVSLVKRQLIPCPFLGS